MTRTAPFILTAISTALLAGCATSSGGGGGAPSPALFAATAGNFSQALADGETLMAYNSQMSSSVEHDSDAEETRAIDPATFSIKANGDDTYEVVINGTPYTFTQSELNQMGMQSSDEFYSVNSRSGDLADVVNSTNQSHHQVWSYWWDAGDGPAISGFAVVGTETMPAALDGKANATYSGWASARLSDTEAFTASTDMFGVLTMSANFDANQISGLITDVEVIGSGSVDGTATLNTGAISGSGFGGTITADSDLLNSFGTSTLDGTYSGKFFGVNGDEIGGVLALSGDNMVGTGYISATQD